MIERENRRRLDESAAATAENRANARIIDQFFAHADAPWGIRLAGFGTTGSRAGTLFGRPAFAQAADGMPIFEDPFLNTQHTRWLDSIGSADARAFSAAVQQAIDDAELLRQQEEEEELEDLLAAEGVLNWVSTPLSPQSAGIGPGGGGGRPKSPVEVQKIKKLRTKIGKTRVIGERHLKSIGAKPKGIKTSHGWRYIDGYVDGVAHESKVGRTGYSKRIREEVKKDVELLKTGQVDEVVWHFHTSPETGKIGPTPELERELLKHGIKIEYHP